MRGKYVSEDEEPDSLQYLYIKIHHSQELNESIANRDVINLTGRVPGSENI